MHNLELLYYVCRPEECEQEEGEYDEDEFEEGEESGRGKGWKEG